MLDKAGKACYNNYRVKEESTERRKQWHTNFRRHLTTEQTSRLSLKWREWRKRNSSRKIEKNLPKNLKKCLTKLEISAIIIIEDKERRLKLWSIVGKFFGRTGIGIPLFMRLSGSSLSGLLLGGSRKAVPTASIRLSRWAFGLSLKRGKPNKKKFKKVLDN